jgi:membrane protein involved in colicin uptake
VLTRRFVQQLLLDPQEVALTDLADRLESSSSSTSKDGNGNNGGSAGNSGAPEAGTGASAGSLPGRSLSATVERRLYDIGSVLSVFNLLKKRLQGGG